MLERRKTPRVKIGNIYIGGNEPIAVQSMLNRRSDDFEGSVAQAKQLEAAGCDISRSPHCTISILPFSYQISFQNKRIIFYTRIIPLNTAKINANFCHLYIFFRHTPAILFEYNRKASP